MGRACARNISWAAAPQPAEPAEPRKKRPSLREILEKHMAYFDGTPLIHHVCAIQSPLYIILPPPEPGFMSYQPMLTVPCAPLPPEQVLRIGAI